MRQLYPVLWVATLGLGAVILLRPGGLGTLLALAANWENVPWSDTYTPPASRSPTSPPRASAPSGPGAGSRPAAWPQAAADVSDPYAEDPRDDDLRSDSSRANPLRYSPPLPPHDRQPWPEPRANEPVGPEAESPISGRYPETGAGAAEPDVPGDYGQPDGAEGIPPGQPLPGNWRPAGAGPAGPQDGPPAWSPPPSEPMREPITSVPPAASVPGAGRVARPETSMGAAASSIRSSTTPFAKPQGVPPVRENVDGLPIRPTGDSQRPVGADMPPRPDATPCEGAEILGRVGSEVILAKELSWGIAELRAQNKEAPQDLLEAKIREILKQRLTQKIDERLVVQDAQRTIPKDNFPKIRDNVAREFEASQVPRLTKATAARTRQELENALEASGSSLEMQKQNFVDGVLAHEWLRQQVKIDEDVGHEEMLDYYRQHVSEFETPARARWEQLTVRLSRFPGREEASAALAQMGNQVLDGAPLAEVAKAQSHGSTAHQGGRWDWTSQGSLASPLLDRAIFGDGVRPGLPVGALSPILEEEQAMHIIRVVQRELPQRTPFVEAQVEIKKKIRAEREAKAKQDYLAKLRRQTPVWTAFDTPAVASTPSNWLR